MHNNMQNMVDSDDRSDYMKHKSLYLKTLKCCDDFWHSYCV